MRRYRFSSITLIERNKIMKYYLKAIPHLIIQLLPYIIGYIACAISRGFIRGYVAYMQDIINLKDKEQ